jgi:hypothetical protein
MSYSIVSPNKFTLAQKAHFEFIKDSFKSFSAQFPDIVSFVKDVDSRYVISNDCTARLVGLSCGKDMTGRFDRDLPCKVSEFAQDFVDEESGLLSAAALCSTNEHKQSSMLNIHKYSTGFEALLSYKYPIIHEPSQSIIGITSLSHKINISYLCSLMPNYLLEFGMVGNFEKIKGELKIDDFPLTEEEHEIVFLMIMRWDVKYVAHFLTGHRELSIPITSEAISECLDELCQRCSCDNVSQLRDKFVDMGFHRKMPDSLLNRLLGSRAL